MTETLVCKDDTKINNGPPSRTISKTTKTCTKARALAQTLRTVSLRLAAAGEVMAAGALMDLVNNMEGNLNK